MAVTIERYPYTLFAGSNEEGALTINSNTVCINGNIATNGTISTTAQYFNVNGMRKENAQEEVKLFFNKINESYFASHVDTYFEDYFLEDTNINVNIPIEAAGDIGLTGNINITSGIKALNDVNLGGNVENTQDSVICAETGDITINTDNVNLNGLVYAPNGSVNITAQNLNINSVIIIADTITINCPNLNANYNSQMAEFIGNESELVINNDDTEAELVAYGDYDEDEEKFTIYWNTTVSEGTFDIQASDDGENYTSLGTVINDDSYEYTFTEPFDKKYIKVVETTKSGKVCEAIIRKQISNNSGVDLTLDTTSNSNYNDFIRNIQNHVIMTPLYGGYSPIDWKPIILKGELNSENGIDTDGDGLTDWEETDVDKLIKYEDGSFDLPTMRDYISKIENASYRESIVRFIEGKLSSASNISVNRRAFAPANNSATAEMVYNMKVYGTTSNPMETDTDGDGYTDLDDPKKDCLPKYLEGRYDLFDGEIYSILKGETCFELNGGAIASNTAIIKAASCDGSDKQRFRFVWHDAKNGYTIHPIADEKKALTFITASHEVHLMSYTSTSILANQLWEVIPSGSSVIFRTKYLETDGNKKTPFYLAYDKTDKKLICVSNDKEKFTISNPAYNWKRFGEIYLDFISVPEKKYCLDDHIEPVFEAIMNYYSNMKIGLDKNNHKPSGINNYEALYDQNCYYGGNYNKLRFGLAHMDDVACEIMATYNALAITGEYDYYDNQGVLTNNLDRFFRLSAEFEINAKLIIDGYFGSNPKKIGNCLKVYNRKYVVYNEDEMKQLDTNIRHAKCAIISYNYGFFHFPIHTFFCYYDNSRNHYNWFNSCYTDELPGSQYTVDFVKDFFKKSDRFKIGYVLL